MRRSKAQGGLFYGSIGFDDRLYLYQSLLPGRPLSTILWGLSADQRAASAVPVFSALKDLWGLPRPGYVGGFNRRGRGALGGFSEPPLPPGEVERRGTPSQYPIDMWWPTMSDFYDYVRQNYLRKGGDPAHWDTEVEPGLDRDAEPVFVHCDIAARNLLFDDDLRLTGIIDFNPVGWYPLEVQWLLLCDELDNCREQGRVEETFLEALVAAVADRLTSSARHAATFWWRGLNGSRLPPAYKRGTMGEA
ncbi:hypothetical protein Rhopal_004185-T1 [Rhodotorula paludigena]|uniref:Aminoglycoside phosphotransferase domain-containing protein n=1 Tax=Rhodotorula paludigena TaxID=86838 RepID=A0AAV5GP67_9BASI|nr:hypothetical protein Rhopal_004185-T1 [Rhodotorula paludigena]